jgi:hypothetical protein
LSSSAANGKGGGGGRKYHGGIGVTGVSVLFRNFQPSQHWDVMCTWADGTITACAIVESQLRACTGVLLQLENWGMNDFMCRGKVHHQGHHQSFLCCCCCCCWSLLFHARTVSLQCENPSICQYWLEILRVGAKNQRKRGKDAAATRVSQCSRALSTGREEAQNKFLMKVVSQRMATFLLGVGYSLTT